MRGTTVQRGVRFLSTLSDSSKDRFLLVEYSALREEIVKRIELEYQLIYLSLATFGVICGLGLPARLSLVILLYPLFAAFLAVGWVNSDHSIQCIANYIKSQIEVKFGEDETGWEHHFEHQRSNGLSALSVGGTFIGTSLVAILVGISLAHLDATEILLLVLSGASLVFSLILLLWYFSKRQNSARTDPKQRQNGAIEQPGIVSLRKTGTQKN